MEQIQTLATSSRSLLGGDSTFSGVIVAVATALAAYKEWIIRFTILDFKIINH